MHVLSLVDFSRATWDPRLLVLDLRDDPTPALDNRLVTWVRSRIPRTTREMHALVALLRGRHVVIVHESEATAVRFADALRAGDVDVRVLERGMAGWERALLAERVDTYGDARVAVLYAPAADRETYVAATAGTAIVINPAGEPAVLIAQAERLEATIVAVVVTSEPGCAAEIAAELGVPYFFSRSHSEETIGLPTIPLRFGTMRIIDDGSHLRVRGAAFAIDAAGVVADRDRVGMR